MANGGHIRRPVMGVKCRPAHPVREQKTHWLHLYRSRLAWRLIYSWVKIRLIDREIAALRQGRGHYHQHADETCATDSEYSRPRFTYSVYVLEMYYIHVYRHVTVAFSLPMGARPLGPGSRSTFRPPGRVSRSFSLPTSDVGRGLAPGQLVIRGPVEWALRGTLVVAPEHGLDLAGRRVPMRKMKRRCVRPRRRWRASHQMLVNLG